MPKHSAITHIKLPKTHALWKKSPSEFPAAMPHQKCHSTWRNV